MTVITEYLAAQTERVNRALERWTPPEDRAPSMIHRAMRYSLFAGVKRIMPVLAMAACEAIVEGGMDGIEDAACALEMIHTYSLIHDDLPALDNDDLRRGRPTCHKLFGEALAILAGDALLAQAFQVLATGIQPPAVAARCCAELAHAAGASALVGGQAADLQAEFQAGGLAELESIHRRKTGAMFLVSLRMGGLVAGANDEKLAGLDAFGQKLGLAFQIVDDLLDLQGDATQLGKRTQKDSAQGKLTFPALLGEVESARRAEQLITEALAALTPFGPKANDLASLAKYVLERKQ